MNIRNSRLAGKGAIFKEAEKRYGVNALYLMAHSALEMLGDVAKLLMIKITSSV